MLICHCRAVNEGAIRVAIAAGAREPDDLSRMCGAGGECGGCLPALLELLDDSAACARVGSSADRRHSAA